MTIVYLMSESTVAEVVYTGAHYSTVRFYRDSVEYVIDVENDEFFILQEIE